MVKERCPVQLGSWDTPIRNGKYILLGALQASGNAHRNYESQMATGHLPSMTQFALPPHTSTATPHLI